MSDNEDLPLLALENFLPYRINRLTDAISREFSAIYKGRYGMTRPEWRTLATLGQFEQATASSIGAHSSMHKTMVSRAVSSLEQRGWIKRVSDEKDRRLEDLNLTPKGISVYRELAQLAHQYEAELFAGMSKTDALNAQSGLDALERRMGLKNLLGF